MDEDLEIMDWANNLELDIDEEAAESCSMDEGCDSCGS